MAKLMNISFTSIVLLGFISTSCPARPVQPNRPASNVLNEQTNMQTMLNIFGELLSNSNSSYQKSISKHVTKKLLEKTSWEKTYNLPVERTTQDVYQATLSGVIDFVERKSFDIAKKESGNFNTCTDVSKLNRNQLEKTITTTGNLATWLE